MRGDDEVRQRAQRVVVRQGFRGGDVDGGGDVPTTQTAQHRAGFDQFGARRVDQQCAGTHQVQLGWADDAARGVVEGQVQADDVRAGEDLVHGGGGFGVQGGEFRGVGVAVPDQQAQADSVGEPGNATADASKTDDAEGPAGQFRDVRAGPAALMGAGVELADAMGVLEHEGDGVLGHRVVPIMHGVADGDAEAAGRIQVDEADGAGAAERDATYTPGNPLQQSRGSAEPRRHDHGGVRHAGGEHILVIRPIGVDAHAGQAGELVQPIPQQRGHRGDAHGHHNERQVGAVGIVFDNRRERYAAFTGGGNHAASLAHEPTNTAANLDREANGCAIGMNRFRIYDKGPRDIPGTLAGGDPAVSATFSTVSPPRGGKTASPATPLPRSAGDGARRRGATRPRPARRQPAPHT